VVKKTKKIPTLRSGSGSSEGKMAVKLVEEGIQTRRDGRVYQHDLEVEKRLWGFYALSQRR
jgi:hypothetical protein